MNDYIKYRIYECPQKPTDFGKYFDTVDTLEEALAITETDKRYFIKGVTEDGKEIIFL